MSNYSVIGVSGPRELSCSRIKLLEAMRRKFDELKPHTIVSGMALGSDLLFAKAALDLGIRVHAAIPGEDQTKGWTIPQINYRQAILDNPLTTSYLVSKGPCNATKYKNRNIYIVYNCQAMVVVKPNKFASGTGHCIRYAESVSRPILHTFDPLTI
jgi:predicted Rossmann fold nucleotide-binding protein DprA/Smf involved in DNA uptake